MPPKTHYDPEKTHYSAKRHAIFYTPGGWGVRLCLLRLSAFNFAVKFVSGFFCFATFPVFSAFFWSPLPPMEFTEPIYTNKTFNL